MVKKERGLLDKAVHKKTRKDKGGKNKEKKKRDRGEGGGGGGGSGGGDGQPFIKKAKHKIKGIAK